MVPSSTYGRDAPSSSCATPAAPSTPAHVLDVSKSAKVQVPTKNASSVASTGRSRDVQCHRCKGIRHLMCDCLIQRALLIKNNGEYTSASDTEDEHVLVATNNAGDEIEEEQLGHETFDKYQSLVVQLVLSAQMELAEQNQHHTLFQSKFIIKEHLCKVIIDGGSYNNLASTDMVEKVGLITTQHPHPYYIQWLNSCGRLKVTKLVRVHFSIGSYHDYIDCDIVPMQACSLLLGRPWQYDRYIEHHGRSNHYTFTYKEKKITLLPMSPVAILKDELERTERTSQEKRKDDHKIIALSEIKLKVPIMLATKSNCIDLEKHESECYAMVCKESLCPLEDMHVSLPPIASTLR